MDESFPRALMRCLGRAFVVTSADGERKLGSSAFAATQPGIIATIYLSPIALLKIKHPMFLRWSVNPSPLFSFNTSPFQGAFSLVLYSGILISRDFYATVEVKLPRRCVAWV